MPLIYCFPEELFTFKTNFFQNVDHLFGKTGNFAFISNVTLYSGEIWRVFPLVQHKVTFCIQNNIITLLGTIAGKRIQRAKMYLSQLRPSLFFVQRRMRFLILDRSVGLQKKNLKKKHHKKSRNGRPWCPRMTLKVNICIFGSTKCAICCKKCSCFCSCFSLCCYYAHFSD